LGDRGLQFIGITEHIEHFTQADIDHVLEECYAHSDASFVFVPGIEMDCFVVYFLGLAPVRVDFTSNRSVFDSLRSASRLCVLSHPVKARFSYPQWVLDACDGVEVLNTKHDGHHYFRSGSERLLRRVRRQKPATIAVAGMDFHGPKNFSDVQLELRQPGPLSERAVLDALAAGQFDIVKGGTTLATVGPAGRLMRRGRIATMDVAHGLHRVVGQSGLRVPRGLKGVLRRLLEGGD